jgi:hypothetical protein
MSKCPQCHKEIDHLLSWYNIEKKCELHPGLKPKRFINETETGVITNVRYKCPLCRKTLCKDYFEALNILKK